jgi:hypothetical protein
LSATPRTYTGREHTKSALVSEAGFLYLGPDQTGERIRITRSLAAASECKGGV